MEQETQIQVENKIKQKRVPKLRFREFDGEWKKLKLDVVTDKIQDGTHFSPKLFEKGNFKYITSKNIRNGYMDLSDVPYLDDEAHHNIYKRCNVKLNDILLTKDGSATGTVCLNSLDEEFSLLSSVAFIRANESLAVNEFIYQCIAGPNGQYEIRSSISGQAITRITLTKLKNFKFSFPSLLEQQKIATFLSAVDKKIQQLNRKKELLETYKKGVMQQLFSQKLRFKDENGKDFPKWKRKSLKEVCNVNPKNSELPESFIYIDLESVNSGRLIKENRISLNEAPSRAQRVLEKNDILFQTVRPYQMNNLFFNRKGDYIASTGYAQLRVTENPMFIFQLIHSKEFVNKVLKRCTGTSYPAINSNDLAKIKVLFPTSNEQQKIADFLSEIDVKIEAVSQQITKTQSFKKGLLQQMFV